MNKLHRLSVIVAITLSTGAFADAPSQEEMWAVIQQQQKQIQALRAELQAARETMTATEEKVAATEEVAEATAVAVDEVIQSNAAPRRKETQLGGYGELHINMGDKDEIDFHRFVLFYSHDFNDRTRFNSELEIEHSLAGDGKPGEVEIEQAYIEHDLSSTTRAKGGLFLVPVGFLNETHEPPTFYGVERNRVENAIIPTTWWEAGAGLSGEVAPGWSYDLAIHSGLNTNSGAGYRIRSGRQKVAEAEFRDAAYTGRVRYTGTPGVELGATLQYQEDITQSSDPLAGSATLFETHAAYQRGPFSLRALFARWDLDGEGPDAVGADEQEGWFIEPGWRINDQVGVFARYSEWDNAAGDDLDSEFSQTDIGVNYWLNANVVLKADYQFEETPSGDGDDRLNLGIGYQF